MKYKGTAVIKETTMKVKPFKPKQKHALSDAVRDTGSVNLTDNTELFKVSPHEGHGNPLDSHVGICPGEMTSLQAGHFLSNRAKWRCSLLLLGTSSSGTEDTCLSIKYQ
jgi:hypothetical protein